MIDLDRYIKFLKKAKVTQEQFLLMSCMYFKRWDLVHEYKDTFDVKDGIIGEFLFNDLINRSYIVQWKEGTTLDCYKVTEKFCKIYVDEHQAIREIFEAYPDYLIRGNKRFILKAVGEDKLRKLYKTLISSSLEEHIEILEDIKYGVEHNLIGMKLESFVTSRGWTTLRKDRLSHTTTPIEDTTF